MRLLVLLALVLVARDARADRVKLRVGTLAVDGSRYMTDILALAKEIESRSARIGWPPGEMTVRFNWVTGGQLGDDKQMAAMIASGKLDGGGLSETGLVALVPDMAAWQYPGLMRDYAAVDRATAALDPKVRELFAKRDLTFLMWADLGFSNLFSTQAIVSLRDVLGRAAPLLTVPLDGHLTEAITRGSATAWALPPLYQVVIGTDRARFMTELRYRYVVGGLVLGKTAWAKLSPAQRKIVVDTCREYEPRLRASWRKETDAGIAALVKAGVAIRPSSPAEATAFFDAAAISRKAHATGAVGELATAIVDSLAR